MGILGLLVDRKTILNREREVNIKGANEKKRIEIFNPFLTKQHIDFMMKLFYPQVMYVGVTYTGNGPYRSEVPAVSSRSLDSNSLFQVE